MQYISPFRIFKLQPQGWDALSLLREKKRLLAEFELTGSNTIQVDGIEVDKSVIIRMSDELAEPREASYHRHIYLNGPLLDFLEKGKLSEGLFSRKILHPDKEFTSFISVFFAGAYAQALFGAVKVNDHRLIGKMINMPFPVEPEQIQAAYGKAYRFLEKWNEDLTGLLEKVRGYGYPEDKKRQLRNDPFLVGLRSVPEELFRIKGNYAEGFLSLYSQVCSKGRLIGAFLSRAAEQRTASGTTFSSTTTTQNKSYQYRSSTGSSSSSGSGNGSRVVYAILLVAVLVIRALISSNHHYNYPSYNFHDYSNLNIPKINWSDTNVYNALKNMYSLKLKASKIAQSLKNYHREQRGNKDDGPEIVYRPRNGENPYRAYLGDLTGQGSNGRLVFVNKSVCDVVALVNGPLSSTSIYIRKGDSASLDNLGKNLFEINFYFGSDWSLAKTHIEKEAWEDSYSIRTGLPRTDSIAGRFKKVPLSCVTQTYYAILGNNAQNFSSGGKYVRFLLRAPSLIKQSDGNIVDTYESSNGNAAPPTITDNETEVREKPDVVVPDHQPEYPGGSSEMYRFLSTNLRYPVIEKESGISGRVYIEFNVNTDGTLSDFNVVKGVPGGPGLEKEALRVIKSMPNWKPGTLNGTPVRAKFILPVRFALN